MGVNNYGTSGQSLGSPSLSAWAASVSDVVNDSDVTVDARVAAERVTERALQRASYQSFTPFTPKVGKLDPSRYMGRPDGATRLDIPSHQIVGEDEATHPSVKFFPLGWNGFRYWMAFTPYPGGNAGKEDPCIAASMDGITWVTPAGFTNPLATGTPTAYNADTELAVSVDGLTLYCLWRYYDPAVVGAEITFRLRSTTDGVTWTPYVVILTEDVAAINTVSPTLVHDGTQWVMWGVNTISNPNTLVRRTCATLTGTWSAPTVCTLAAHPERDLWHVSIIKLNDGYVGLLNDCTVNVSGVAGNLYLISSTDGLTWSIGDQRLIPQALPGEYDQVYRGCIVPTPEGFDMWYGAWITTPQTWGIYRTKIAPVPIRREPVGLVRARFLTQQPFIAGTVVRSTGTCHVVPFYVPEKSLFTQIAVEVTTLGAGATVTLGVYDSDADRQPRNLINTVSTLVDASTTGTKSQTGQALTLEPGWYWGASLVLVAGVTLRASTPSHPLVYSPQIATALTGPSCYTASAQSVLPATWTSTTAAINGTAFALYCHTYQPT